MTPCRADMMTCDVFRAALCCADITPDRDVYLEGYEDHGELSLCRYPVDHTSDLKARLLLLDNGRERLLHINLELLFSDVQHQVGTLSSEVIEKLAAACHTRPDCILLSNTHTHHAPMQLFAPQEAKLLEAAEKAYEALRPVRLKVGRGHTSFGVSRGNDYGIDYDLPYDDEITLLRFDDAQTGKALGMAFSVPLHNTMYGHGPGLKPNRHRLNCELTGYACRALERWMGPGFVAMHINGFYGNAGPVYQGRFYAESLEELKQAGEAFAQQVMDIYTPLEKTEPVDVCGQVRTVCTRASLPVEKTRAWKAYFGLLPEKNLLIQAGCFGKIAFVGVNFEPFSILGARLRAESPYPITLPAANVNGWRGYVPTKEAFARHAQAAEVECQPVKTPLTAQGEEAFYSAVLETLCRMAGVSIHRQTATLQSVAVQPETAVYTFAFDSPQQPDKLVLSFGQDQRTDCASSFVLELLDQEDRVICLERRAHFSSGYLGIFTGCSLCSRVRLTVQSRYGYGKQGIGELTPRIQALIFMEKLSREDCNAL